MSIFLAEKYSLQYLLFKCLMGSLYYRVTLQFWDDLAIVASEHVKKGDRIFVSGRLVSDTVDEGPEKRHVYYKVLHAHFHYPSFL